MIYGYPTSKKSGSSNSRLNPRRQRTQDYSVSRTSGYSASGTPNGQSNGKNNYAGKTPPVSPLPNGDKDATFGYLGRNN